jgi:hypothetical protein
MIISTVFVPLVDVYTLSHQRERERMKKKSNRETCTPTQLAQSSRCCSLAIIQCDLSVLAVALFLCLDH